MGIISKRVGHLVRIQGVKCLFSKDELRGFAPTGILVLIPIIPLFQQSIIPIFQKSRLRENGVLKKISKLQTLEG